MGDTAVKDDLTLLDILSVILYRVGIVFATLSLIYASLYFYYFGIVGTVEGMFLFTGYFPYIVFWIFVVEVGVSTFFLHLYSRQILRGIQVLYVLGFIIIVFCYLFVEGSLSLAFRGEGFVGKLMSMAIGLVLASFSAIGAKEAYCFRLKEGYLYAILSFILVVLHLIGLGDNVVLVFLLILISILTSIFSIRKLNHPLHYDIGDKSKYQKA